MAISSVQSLSHVQTFVSPWTAAHQASLSITNFRSLLKLKSIKLVMPSNHLILCCPLLLLPSVFPSIRVFSNEPILCIKWSKYWSFSCSISTSNEYSGLISSRIDWLDLLAVQGTLKSLLQHQSSKASIDQFINYLTLQSVQFNHVWLFATPCTAACQFSLSITSSQNLPKLMSIELVMPSNHLILCHPPPFFSCPQSFPASRSFPMSQLFA